MQKDQPFLSYEARLQRVLAYIYDHLDDELSLNHLADIACMSPYHWHRIFRAMTGETLAETVRGLRLAKAANALLEEDTPIREIAAQVGYKNLAGFSRAFKCAHGLSPQDFRNEGQKITNLVKKRTPENNLYPVHIEEIKGFCAAGVAHIGPYQQIGKCFKQLGGILVTNSLMPLVETLFVVYHDVPGTKPAEELRAHVAVSIKKDFPENQNGLEYFNIEGGRYAILEHTGPYARLRAAYDWLYGTWLPNAGVELRNAPPLEVYVNDPKTTPSAELRTDIWLPIL